jgi:hypothetical protein
MTVLVDRYHPARNQLPKLARSPRAFGQATIRHAVFGIVLGLVEDALNNRSRIAHASTCANIKAGVVPALTSDVLVAGVPR